MSEISILVEELAKVMGDLGITPLYLYEKDDKKSVKGTLLDPNEKIPDAKPVKNQGDGDGDPPFDDDGNQTKYSKAFLSLIKELVELGTEWKNEKDIFEHSCGDKEQPDDKSVEKLLEVVNTVKKKLNFISETFETSAKKMTLLEQKICYDIIESFKIDICVVTTALQKIEENKKNSDKIETKPKEDKKKDDEKSTGTALVPTQTTGTDLVPVQSTGTALIPTQSTEVTTTSKEPEKKEKTGTALMTMSDYKTAVANSKQGFSEVLTIGSNVLTIGVKYLPELTKSLLEALGHTSMMGVYFMSDSISYVWKTVMNTTVFMSDLLSGAISAIKKLLNNKVVKTAAGLMVGLAVFSPLGALLLNQKDLLKDFIKLPVDIIGIVPSTVKGMITAVKGVKDSKTEKRKNKEIEIKKKYIPEYTTYERKLKELKDNYKEEKENIIAAYQNKPDTMKAKLDALLKEHKENEKKLEKEYVKGDIEDYERELDKVRSEYDSGTSSSKNGKYYDLSLKNNFKGVKKEGSRAINAIKNTNNVRKKIGDAIKKALK